MKIGVVTIVAGRPQHLRQQAEGLGRSTVRPDCYVVVAMDGLLDYGELAFVPDVLDLDGGDGPLPLAAARNLGARHALDHGCELLVMLDVDCIPSPEMISLYRWAACTEGHPDGLLCGPVAELPPAPASGYELGMLPALGTPFPGRPVPAHGELVVHDDHHLFWSMSFAVTAAVWEKVGGFWPEYVGYGAEDTDFAQSAKAMGLPMVWVGGAWAYHQHHPKNEPPTDHLEDIVRNGAVFQRRWGWWPMSGWLQEFRQMGLVGYDSVEDRWSLAGTSGN